MGFIVITLFLGVGAWVLGVFYPYLLLLLFFHVEFGQVCFFGEIKFFGNIIGRYNYN